MWLTGTIICLPAANSGSNCLLTRAMDGRIVRCGIISWCQSAARSEIVKAHLATSSSHVRRDIASTGLYLFTFCSAAQCSLYSNSVAVLPCVKCQTDPFIEIQQTRINTAKASKKCKKSYSDFFRHSIGLILVSVLIVLGRLRSCLHRRRHHCNACSLECRSHENCTHTHTHTYIDRQAASKWKQQYAHVHRAEPGWLPVACNYLRSPWWEWLSLTPSSGH